MRRDLHFRAPSILHISWEHLLAHFPAGILSDRYGRVPIMRIGLVITVTSGLLLSVLVSPFPVIVTRIIEGVGAWVLCGCSDVVCQFTSGP